MEMKIGQGDRRAFSSEKITPRGSDGGPEKKAKLVGTADLRPKENFRGEGADKSGGC